MTSAVAGQRAAPSTRSPAGRWPGTGALVVGGDYQGLGIVRSLGRHHVPVVVIDDERSIAAASRYVTHHERVPDLRRPDQALAALLEVAERLDLQGWVLYPTREETVAMVAQHRADLARRYRVPTPPLSSVEAAWDKRRTYQLAEELGIPVPRCWFPHDEAELATVDLSAPVVVKPAIKENFFYATGAKAWRADDREQLRDAYRRATAVVRPDEVIVQELVAGGGDAQLAYCALFKEQQAVATMTVRRHRQHPSDFGRASTFVETIDLPELEELALRFLRAIDYYGLVELEFKHDRTSGSYKLLDVNARTWGYHTLGAAAGVDFPYLLYLDQLGRSLPTVRARSGVRWIRLVTDVPNAARDIRAGAVDVRGYLRTLRGIDTEAVFSARDPLPGLYELALLPYLAVKRGL
ncbi:MAG: carboxylate--amine ligase [Nocardioidaceae bacterium]